MSPRNVPCWLAALLLAVTFPLAARAEDHSTPVELRHNLPFVQVMVNGKGPFTFSIDTGTGGEALVTPDLIKQLNLPVMGEAEVGDPSGLNPHKVSMVRIASLAVAGVEFHDVHAVQFQPSRRDGPCDGILGFVLFRQYLLTLDYPQQQMRLASGKLTPDGGNTVIPFTMPRDVPVIQLTVGTRQVDAHLDSRGAGLSFPEKFAQDLKFVSDPVVIGRGRTVSNEFEIKGGQLAGDVRIGGYSFSRPFVETNPVLPFANFGAAPLQYFAVTFDQSNKLIRLESKDKTLILAAPRRPEPTPTPALTH